MADTLGRRQFLYRSTFLAAGVLAGSLVPRRVRGQSSPRIVIVGGGLAGLTAAYQLSTRYGVTAALYEANTRWGGRAWTERGFAGQYIEHGGQFISSGDRAIRKLLRSLAVGLIDTKEIGSDGSEKYRFLGQPFDYEQLAAALAQAEDNAWTHAREAGRAARYNRKNTRTEYWDSVSVASWIDNYCPGGLASAAGQYLKAKFETEYGGSAAEASALQLIYDLGVSASPAAFDERYLVQGGTDQIVSALLDRLPGASLNTGMKLQRLQSNPDGSVRCTFDSSAGSIDVDADRVILALPFSTLRDVDYAALGFDPRLDSAIQSLGMGTNAKLHLQFSGAPWQPSYNGDSLSDVNSGATWEESVGQPGPNHLLVLFNGGDFGAQYGMAAAHGGAPAGVVSSHLADIESIFSGTTAAFTGQAYLDYWSADVFTKGSYSFYKVGQMTTFAGFEGSSQGRVHFAGEHTAVYAHRATLNGAVESGIRVAREVIRALV